MGDQAPKVRIRRQSSAGGASKGAPAVGVTTDRTPAPVVVCDSASRWADAAYRRLLAVVYQRPLQGGVRRGLAREIS